VNADGGAMLFVHDIRVLAEPKNISGAVLTGSVRLKAGWHSLRLYYRHISGAARLELTVKDAAGVGLNLGGSNLRKTPT
jgi:hypothetical protein